MSSEIYDLIYSSKKYDEEAKKIKDIFDKNCISGGNRMLDVACGTGKHMEYLRNDFNIDGIDLSINQVTAARKKFPNNRIEQSNMIDFDMNDNYDIVVCLFSSIGYLLTKDNLDESVRCMTRHLKPGGILLIEPWIRQSQFRPNHISFESAQIPDKLAVARTGITTAEGKITTLNLHHMVTAQEGVSHFVENHKLAMFDDEEFIDSFNKAGLRADVDPVGLTNRRLIIGSKSL